MSEANGERATWSELGLILQVGEVGEFVGKNHQKADEAHHASENNIIIKMGVDEVREEKTGEASRDTSEDDVDQIFIFVFLKDIGKELLQTREIIDNEDDESAEAD